MKYVLIIIFCVLFTQTVNSKIEYTKIPHLDSAIFYMNLPVIEKTGHNDGTYVKMFLKEVGLIQDSWCSAFISYITQHTAGLKTRFKTALARNIRSKNDISIKDVIYSKKTAKPGFAAVLHNGNTIHGHVCLVYKQLKCNLFQTIEGNLNNKIDINIRSYNPRNYQRIHHFTPILYKDDKMNMYIDTVNLKSLNIKSKTSNNTR